MRRVSLRLLNLDCLYPRDLLQPARKKKTTPTFNVQQWLHFPLPQVFKNQAELLNMARFAAAEGYITPAAILFLSHSLSNTDMTFKKTVFFLLRVRVGVEPEP